MKQLGFFPQPSTQSRDAQTFRAWRHWERNVCAAAVAAVGALTIFCIVGGILLWGAQRTEDRLLGAGMILVSIAAGSTFLLGNLAAFWPYAAEVYNRRGLWVYAPFERYYVPIEDIKRIRPSWLWGGWVVTLGKRRGLLSWFVIHVAWGRQGIELIQLIREELAARQRTRALERS